MKTIFSVSPRARARALALGAFALIHFLCPATHADSLTVYAYPSPTGINWTSPNTLAWSTIASMLKSDKELYSIHAIGHMNFDLICAPSAANPGGAHVMTGQTSQSSSQEMSEIFKQGYGLDVFLTPVPGRWEGQAEIEHDLPIRFQRGSVAFIEFKLRPSSCARVVRYLKEYKSRGYDQIYGGLQDRPRLGQGGGCSAFTEGVMEIAGVMSETWKAYFSHQVFVPDTLLGGPQFGHHVSFMELLFGIQSISWNRSASESYNLNFWDPYYAYYWIETATQRPLQLSGMSYTPARKGNARGIAIDASQLPTPTESFWQ